MSFTAGSAAARQLSGVLEQRGVIDIPTVFGGEALYSKTVEEIRAPHDRSRVLARIHRPTVEQMRAAIASSLSAAHDWTRLPFEARAAVFLRAAEIIATRRRIEINAATMLGQSKTIDQAEPDSACELIDFLRFNVYYAQRLYREQPISVQSATSRADWRALEGFVYAISPFNFTAIGANLSSAPALMGNTVLWKPSEKSAWANYVFFRTLQEAGLPPGVINFVPASAHEMTRVALASPDLAGIHFTGSTDVFRSLWEGVGTQIGTYRSFPRLVGETGGKGFVLAHASADVESLTVALIRGAFEFQGQKCSAASRAYIPRSLWSALRQRVQERLAALRVGDVADPSVFMGAVIDRASYLRLERRLAAAKVDTKVAVVAGGKTTDDPGYFVYPTVLEVSDPSHALMCDELFGPILSVFVYEDSDWRQTLKLVDSSSPYALTGSIFCNDRGVLREAQDALINAAGNLYVNDKPTGAIIGQQPFGGTRASGTNDKAGSWMNLLRWTSPRVVKETYGELSGWQFGG